LKNKKRSTETSIILLDKSFFLIYLLKNSQRKEGRENPLLILGNVYCKNEGRMPVRKVTVRKVRGKGGDKKEEGWANN
jgi:hypothetical protein